MDLFTVPTVTFKLLYCFFIISHDRRQILHCSVTQHPTSGWVGQQLREAFPYFYLHSLPVLCFCYLSVFRRRGPIHYSALSGANPSAKASQVYCCFVDASVIFSCSERLFSEHKRSDRPDDHGRYGHAGVEIRWVDILLVRLQSRSAELWLEQFS